MTVSQTVTDELRALELRGLTGEEVKENLKDGELVKAAKSILTNNNGSWPKAIAVKHRDIVADKSDFDKVCYVIALLTLEAHRLWPTNEKPSKGW